MAMIGQLRGARAISLADEIIDRGAHAKTKGKQKGKKRKGKLRNSSSGCASIATRSREMDADGSTVVAHATRYGPPRSTRSIYRSMAIASRGENAPCKQTIFLFFLPLVRATKYRIKSNEYASSDKITLIARCAIIACTHRAE